jgi:ribosomal protein L19
MSSGNHHNDTFTNCLNRVTFIENLSIAKFTGIVVKIQGSGLQEMSWLHDPIESITQGFWINMPTVVRVEIVHRNYAKVDRNLVKKLFPGRLNLEASTSTASTNKTL